MGSPGGGHRVLFTLQEGGESMFIGEMVSKRDGVIGSSSVHRYEKRETFLNELPMGCKETSKGVWLKDCGSGWTEEFKITEERRVNNALDRG